MQSCLKTLGVEGAWVESEMIVSYEQDDRRVQGLGWWWREDEM